MISGTVVLDAADENGVSAIETPQVVVPGHEIPSMPTATQIELERCRKDCAELRLALRKVRRELDFIRLRAANLLVNQEALDPGITIVELLEDISTLKGLHERIYDGLIDLQQQVEKTHSESAVTVDDQDVELILARTNLILHDIRESGESFVSCCTIWTARCYCSRVSYSHR